MAEVFGACLGNGFVKFLAGDCDVALVETRTVGIGQLQYILVASDVTIVPLDTPSVGHPSVESAGHDNHRVRRAFGFEGLPLTDIFLLHDICKAIGKISEWSTIGGRH